MLFVHSPLVGPSSLRRIASAAAGAGYEVALPDLTAVANSKSPHDVYVRLACEAGRTLTKPIVIVGHSGAGAFLPLIGAAVEGSACLLFVDAVVPPSAGAHTTSTPMRSMLDEKTVEGLLDPWLDWWSLNVVERLLPDPTDRAELRSDMPRLVRSFYDLDVAVPDSWSDSPCAYLRLSSAYTAEADDARARGWPTAELDSTHLAPHTSPDEVLAAIIRLMPWTGANDASERAR